MANGQRHSTKRNASQSHPEASGQWSSSPKRNASQSQCQWLTSMVKVNVNGQSLIPYLRPMLSALLKQLLILPIRLYQIFLSPLLGANKCRYQPTCSHYAIEAIQKRGIFMGTYLAVKRILRCHPWSTHPMHDPVPEKEEGKKNG